MLYVHSSKSMREKMDVNGEDIYRNNFSLQRHVSSYLSILNQLFHHFLWMRVCQCFNKTHMIFYPHPPSLEFQPFTFLFTNNFFFSVEKLAPPIPFRIPTMNVSIYKHFFPIFWKITLVLSNSGDKHFYLQTLFSLFWEK